MTGFTASRPRQRLYRYFQDDDYDVISRIKVLPSVECTRSVCPAHKQQRSPVPDFPDPYYIRVILFTSKRTKMRSTAGLRLKPVWAYSPRSLPRLIVRDKEGEEGREIGERRWKSETSGPIGKCVSYSSTRKSCYRREHRVCALPL